MRPDVPTDPPVDAGAHAGGDEGALSHCRAGADLGASEVDYRLYSKLSGKSLVNIFEIVTLSRSDQL